MRPKSLGIKTKLYLTYITGMLITVILMFSVGYIVHGDKLFKSDKEEEGSRDVVSYAFQFRELNSVEEASRSINQATINLRNQGAQDFLITTDFWEVADFSFRPQVSLVVFRNDEPLYVSKKLDPNIELEKFPKYGQVGVYPNAYLFEQYETTIQRQMDYQSDNGDQVTAFILLSVWNPSDRFYMIILNNILVFMLISTVIMGIISWFVVRSITVPLDDLIEAANAVRRGNLENEVKATSSDKIGELSQAFEAMRLQLLQNERIRDQYEESRQEMISSISHDLRTPVTAIKLHAEGIMDGVAGSPEKMSKYLKSMSNNATVVDQLLRELTLFSNLDSEKESFQFSSVRLQLFLQDLIDEWQYNYEDNNVTFSLESSCEENTVVKLDVIHFRRVLVNIVENAVKYVDNRPLRVDLSTVQKDQFVRLTIGDNGEGVPEVHLEQIFNRFHRIDTARQSSVPGSGLGLAIARQIVLKHRGRIWAENKPEGGLAICIDLPYLKEADYEKNTDC